MAARRCSVARRREVPGMATIVIVPAAFQGGWRWQEVRVALQAAGHEVYALTLTGLGERSHLATPEISLDTHTQDVVNTLEYEDLRDVVLIGQSYSGMVLTAVADRAAARLARLIYVDAVLPRDGECMLDLFSPPMRAAWAERGRKRARAGGSHRGTLRTGVRRRTPSRPSSSRSG